MGLFSNNLDKYIEVDTKEKFTKAAKEGYGYIQIHGELMDEIKKDQEVKANASTATGILGIVLGLTSFINPLLAIPAFISFGASSVLDKQSSYQLRISKSTDDSLFMMHNKTIAKIVKGYKGKEKLKANNIDDLSDMMLGNVNNIYIDKKYIDDMVNLINNTGSKDKFDIENEFKKNKKYKFVNKPESTEYLFVRIR